MTIQYTWELQYFTYHDKLSPGSLNTLIFLRTFLPCYLPLHNLCSKSELSQQQLPYLVYKPPDLVLLALVTRVVMYTTCQVHVLSGTRVVRYTCCQVHVLSGTCVVRYTTCQVHVLSGTRVVRYTCCQVHVLSGTRVVRYTCCQVHVLSGTPAVRYGWVTIEPPTFDLLIIHPRTVNP